MPSPTKLIVVSGMHRSGTSFLSRIVSRLGAFFPGPLIESDEFNPAGYLENIPITSIHDQLLVDLGRTWSGRNGHQPLPEAWMSHPSTLSASKKVKALLDDYLSEGHSCIAIKDPRISLLLPLWYDVCRNIDAEIVFVFALRHPAAVAKSLVRRDQFTVGMSIWRSQLLWRRYNSAIVEGFGDTGPVFFDHTSWKTAPEKQIQRLCSYTGLRTEASKDELGRLVGFDPSEHTSSRLTSQEAIHPDVINFYHQLVKYSENSLPKNHLQQFNRQNPMPEFTSHRASKTVHRIDRLKVFTSNFIASGVTRSPRNLTRKWQAAANHARNWPFGVISLPFFLPEWIYEQLPKLRHYERDPVAWYLRSGEKRGITPHPLISRWYYERQCKGQRVGEIVGHYLTVGWHQGLSTHPLFDPDFYHDQCQKKGISVDGPPLRHFLLEGIKRDIPSSPYFDPVQYRSQNPDVAGSMFYPISHYLIYGWKDGRSPDGSFSPAVFLKTADYDADLDPFSYSLQEHN